MAAARDDAIAVLEQELGGEAVGHRGVAADGEVQLAPAHRVERRAAAVELDGEGGPGGVAAERRHQLGAHERGDEFRRRDRKASHAVGGIEARLAPQHFAGEIDQRVDARTKFEGAAGRLQAVRAADEERIVEQIAQPREGVADGGLAEAEFAADRRGAPLAQQAPEDQKQAAVDAPDIVVVDIAHETNSVMEFRAPRLG